MIPNMKNKRWIHPREFKVPKKNMEGESVLTIPAEQVIPYGLTELLIKWSKDQREAEVDIDKNSLPAEVSEYLKKKTHGCAFPPCRGMCPSSDELERKKNIKFVLNETDVTVLEACLGIACCSSIPWACHHSNARQALQSRAMGFLSLYHEQDTIYKAYLGQDIVWDLYLKMVTILKQISSNWLPWHNVTEENRVSSDHQLLKGVRDGDELDPIVGVVIAQSAAEVDLKYRKGMATIWKVVQDMCGISMVPDSNDEMDTGTSTRKISNAVCNATQDFFQVCAFQISINFIFITTFH